MTTRPRLSTLSALLSSAIVTQVMLGLLAAPVEAAEPHAILARGFDADQVYDFNGIDQVNLFNGNLVVTIPIGQRYPVNAGFEYGFTLVYNSHVWDYVVDHPLNGKDEFGEGGTVILTDPAAVDEGQLRGIPNPKSNAGTSWRLTLGELYDVDSPLFPGRGWVFVGPDGAERSFRPAESQTTDSPQFTADGSNFRLRKTDAAATSACIEVSGTCMAVDLPDGVTYAFEPTAGPVGWRLRRIQDPFGNWVAVTYGPGTWTVSDSLGRSHEVQFDAAGVVSSVTLEAFGGQPAVYGFATEASPPTLPGCPHDFELDDQPVFEFLTHLTGLELPDGSQYSFSYVTDDGFTGKCSHFDGRLETVTLPTAGKIHYGYDAYHFPVLPCETPPIRSGYEKQLFATQWGVSRRTVEGIGGATLSERHYSSGGLTAAPSRLSYTDPETKARVCILPRTTYTDVYEKADQGRYKLTRHFFSVGHNSTGLTGEREPYEHTRYGLPIDHLTPDPANPGHFRSSMVFDCPGFPAPTVGYGPDWPSEALHLRIPTSCYDADGDGGTQDRFWFPEDVRGLRDRYMEHHAGAVHYCDDDFTTNPGCETADWRVRANVTYFYDSKGDYHVKTERNDFDGYGHYRSTTTSSNSPGSMIRTVFTDFQPEVTAQRWLLGLFDERSVSETDPLSDREQTARETYSFDRSTGFLDHKTTHRSGGNLLANFTPDGFGNVRTETYTGGDPGTGSYTIHNKHDSGTLALSEYRQGGDTILRTVDAEIDPSTGLPTASRDETGLETEYGFDAMGRLTSMAQQGLLAEAATIYTYRTADPQRADKRASVTITRDDTSSEIFFDGLGRVNEERSTLPDSSINRRFTTFTPQGQADTMTTLHDNADRANARKTRTDYDVFGRPTRVWRPDDGLTLSGESRTSYFYDGIFGTVRQTGHVETPEGPQVLRTSFSYDHQSRLVEVEELENDPDDLSLRLRTTYRYDEGGRLVRVNQRNIGTAAQIRSFEYDEAGFLTRECHPELAGGCIEYRGFDARGNPARLRYTDGGGDPFELDYRYDAAERLTQVRSAEDGRLRLLKEFFYTNLYNTSYGPADGNGKLYQSKRHNRLGSLDVVATVTNTYGGIGGRLSRRLVTTGGDGDVPRVRFTTKLAYDSLGNLAQITYPDCLQAGCESEPPDRSVSRSYTRGLLTGVGTLSDPDRFARLTYHPNRTVQKIVHGNGVTDDFTQDPSQLPRPGGIEIRTGPDPGLDTLWSSTYTYDGTGNIVSRTSTGFQNDDTILFDGTDEFRYDNAFNRLVSSTIHYPLTGGPGRDDRSYTYDRYGNLTTISSSANPRILSPDPATNRLESPFTYDAAGNLTSQPGWDAAGNPIGPPDWYYTYDPFNMMTRARNASGSVTREYLYTADDERLAVLTPGRELWTLRGPDARVLRDVEYLSTGWRWVEDYIHRGSGLLATLGDVTGERHQHLDHLGSPRLVTDPTGQVLARHVHAPYGEELTSTNQDELRMKFTGHERDDLDSVGSAGDLDYMHARLGSPQLARFLSVDPEPGRPGVSQQWNRYTYVLSNPILYVDPDGLAVETGWDAANVALGATTLIANIATGNVAGAIVDAGGLVLDLGATAVPVVPGGAATGIKTYRASRFARNVRFGRAFEKAALDALDLSKNSSRVDSARRAYRVPDAFAEGVLVEVKGVQELRLTDQVKDFLVAAAKENRRVVIAVRNDTRVHKDFAELLEGGEVTIVRFKPE